MSSMITREGFLLTRQWKEVNRRLSLDAWIWTEQGPVHLRFTDQEAVCFIHQDDEQQARRLLSGISGWRIQPLSLTSFDNKPVAGIYFKQQRSLYRAREQFSAHQLSVFEADIQPYDRFFMERFITGGLLFQGHTSDRFTHLESLNPAVKPSACKPLFKVASVDIETSMDGKLLFSIGICFGLWGEPWQDLIFVLGDGLTQQTDYIHYLPTEQALLQAFIQWMQTEDPDILIGWSVVNFDLRFLQRKADDLNMPFAIGRGCQTLDWRQSRDDDEYFTLVMPGRVVLDGIETLKSATYNFESFSLEFVSREVLNRGKKIDHPDDRGEQITHLFYENKEAFIRYNLEDCHLVWDIFDELDLMNFAIDRTSLTGLAMDRFGGSVAAFDYRYLPRLHRAGYVAPQMMANPVGVGSPGGFVMDSTPGLYHDVLVLDFKSLYPSIIRTFHIDPLALMQGFLQHPVEAKPGRKETELEPSDQLVAGFNGAVFDKDRSLLPDIIGELWTARDEAKRQKRAAMSQAIKIIMNSFYGVLGTSGCRFFDFRLPSSITCRGHQILNLSKAYIEEQGYKVIYGDTDSIFVWLGSDAQNPLSPENATKMGQLLEQQLNEWWQQHLQQQYRLESRLEIEFETHFKRFFMPTIRGSEKGSKKRYAGLMAVGQEEKLVFKGLETVRTDWTHLAREFQTELYRRVFADEQYEAYILDIVPRLRQGEFDSKLVYRKRLRRKLADYVKQIPPQIGRASCRER